VITTQIVNGTTITARKTSKRRMSLIKIDPQASPRW
jgi:hypothetical protein